jgi:hypothetical protein
VDSTSTILTGVDGHNLMTALRVLGIPLPHVTGPLTSKGGPLTAPCLSTLIVSRYGTVWMVMFTMYAEEGVTGWSNSGDDESVFTGTFDNDWTTLIPFTTLPKTA